MPLHGYCPNGHRIIKYGTLVPRDQEFNGFEAPGLVDCDTWGDDQLFFEAEEQVEAPWVCEETHQGVCSTWKTSDLTYRQEGAKPRD